MTTAVTTTDGPSAPDVQVVDGPTLKELAATANHEHQQVLEAAGAMVQHAIKVGEALRAARVQVKSGTWSAWLKSNFEASYYTAAVCMRLALYQEHLPADVETIKQATVYLRRLPDSRSNNVGGSTPHSAAVRSEALRLLDSGLSITATSEIVGVGQNTLRGWRDPEYEQRQRDHFARRRAKIRQEREERKRTDRDEAARKIGGSVAECYSQIRKTLQALDRAHGDTTDRDARAALSTATAKLHEAEDQIVRTLGVATGHKGVRR